MDCEVGVSGLIPKDVGDATPQLYVELWVSLASLLRSYTAAHGLNGNLQATVELGEERITVRHGDNWLDLGRDGAEVNWRREDESTGALEFTQAGTLRSLDPRSPNARDMGHPEVEKDFSEQGFFEEEMDMAAERWARELMSRELAR
jgi:hypothetical protein